MLISNCNEKFLGANFDAVLCQVTLQQASVSKHKVKIAPEQQSRFNLG